MDIIQRFLPTGILLLATIGFGFWVGRRGRPYHNLLFNIHKLLALAGVVITGIRFFRLVPASLFPTTILILAATALIPVIVLFTTGAIMSIREEESKSVLLFHQLSLAAIFILIAAAFLIIT
jgi:hypothetical protein